MFDPVKVNLSEDLIVYKFLEREFSGGVKRYLSPYYGRSGPWRQGVRAVPFPTAGSLIDSDSRGRRMITAGMFHSYKYVTDALNQSGVVAGTSVCRFRIPKDATVYAGVTFGGKPTYASTAIIFETELSYEEIEKLQQYEQASVLKK